MNFFKLIISFFLSFFLSFSLFSLLTSFFISKSFLLFLAFFFFFFFICIVYYVKCHALIERPCKHLCHSVCESIFVPKWLESRIHVLRCWVWFDIALQYRIGFASLRQCSPFSFFSVWNCVNLWSHITCQKGKKRNRGDNFLASLDWLLSLFYPSFFFNLWVWEGHVCILYYYFSPLLLHHWMC